MDVQIPLLVIGRKMFRVMSTHYRTCGVTRLKIIILLSTSLNGSMRNIYRKCSGMFEIVSKDESENVTSFYGLHTWIYPTRWQPHKRDMDAWKCATYCLHGKWVDSPHGMWVGDFLKGMWVEGEWPSWGSSPPLMWPAHGGGSPLALLLPSPLWPSSLMPI